MLEGFCEKETLESNLSFPVSPATMPHDRFFGRFDIKQVLLSLFTTTLVCLTTSTAWACEGCAAKNGENSCTCAGKEGCACDSSCKCESCAANPKGCAAMTKTESENTETDSDDNADDNIEDDADSRG